MFARMKSTFHCFVFLLQLLLTTVHSASPVFNVLHFGAHNDGSVVCTEAIAKAVTAASSSASGAGVVHFPPGHYLTGPIHLRSHVTLDLADNALVTFSPHFDHYLPMVEVRWEGTVLRNFSPLIYGYNVSEVAIVGSGNATIDGNGPTWWTYYRTLKKLHSSESTNQTKWQQEFRRANTALLANLTDVLDDPARLELGFLRPQLLQVLHSDHVTIRGVHFRNSPFWTLNPAFSDHILIERVHIDGVGGANTDGIDPDSCTNVHITNCVINTGDDCVCIKSGRDHQGRQLNRPSENITITDSVMYGGHGGLAIGSETAGSIRNVFARNLTMVGTDRAVRIKSGRGCGGTVSNVHISDVHVTDMKHEGIVLTAYYTFSLFDEPKSARTPHFHDIRFDNVTGSVGGAGIQVMGLKEQHIERVEFHRVHLTAAEPDVIRLADGLIFDDVTTFNGSSPTNTPTVTLE